MSVMCLNGAVNPLAYVTGQNAAVLYITLAR